MRYIKGLRLESREPGLYRASCSDGVQNELAAIEAKLESAREAAAAPGASARDKADLKLLEQQYLVARRTVHRQRGRDKSASHPADTKERVDKSSTKP